MQMNLGTCCESPSSVSESSSSPPPSVSEGIVLPPLQCWASQAAFESSLFYQLQKAGEYTVTFPQIVEYEGSWWIPYRFAIPAVPASAALVDQEYITGGTTFGCVPRSGVNATFFATGGAWIPYCSPDPAPFGFAGVTCDRERLYGNVTRLDTETILSSPPVKIIYGDFSAIGTAASTPGHPLFGITTPFPGGGWTGPGVPPGLQWFSGCSWQQLGYDSTNNVYVGFSGGPTADLVITELSHSGINRATLDLLYQYGPSLVPGFGVEIGELANPSAWRYRNCVYYMRLTPPGDYSAKWTTFSYPYNPGRQMVWKKDWVSLPIQDQITIETYPAAPIPYPTTPDNTGQTCIVFGKAPTLNTNEYGHKMTQAPIQTNWSNAAPALPASVANENHTIRTFDPNNQTSIFSITPGTPSTLYNEAWASMTWPNYAY